MRNWTFGTPKVAYISGGGSGIGLNIANELLEEGCSVALFDLKFDDEVLRQLRKQCRASQKVEVYVVDITDPQAVDAAMDEAAQTLGAADLALNSAGILRTGVFTEMPYETFEQVVRINLLGSRNFAASALRHMHSGSHLVLVASLAGIVGTYTQAAYVASKHGVVGLAEVLRLEQKLKGIDVSVICPGEISTPLLTYEREHGSNVTKRLNEIAGVLTVDEAVSGIMKGLRSREFMITPGFRAKILRAVARKASGLFRRTMDINLAKAIAEDQALSLK
ncbi:SDR family NAD(P)-dependent oxidoreductase [Pseudomonas sp. MS19]|uniref:SDR family NAD(P)-dependent oxidoreductase n=1 Tax=Pseudomonas sp. MS19 TaxID=2579939 RepID=UPI001562E990|nr:SDR family NAD(P)-dependent oxidoreductase [Pseudomonas sp. MS19]NRH28389.1 SDR family NAD(P)-dependent oxidoreductase [Pseudomonas sp. MS19]